MIRAAIALLLALALVPSLPAPAALAQGAPAQSPPQERSIDFQAWETDATRAENLLEAGTASTAFFENLRATLVEWRAQFLAAESANANRIASLQAQIEALGPAPAEGEAEADAIAARRAELNEALARARVPGVNAAAALTRADGLIAEIDTLLRERQQQQLLQLDPSPLNPLNWAVAATALTEVTEDIVQEIRTRAADPVRREALVDNAPGTLLLTLLGLMALLRGRRWTELLTDRLQARAGVRGRRAAAFVVSLLQVAVPLAGVLLMMSAILTTGLLDRQGSSLIEALAGLAVAVYVARWIAGRLFREGTDAAFANLRADPALAAAARQVTVLIGVGVGLALFFEGLAALDAVPPAAHGVLQLPIYLLLSYLYWRLARLFQADSRGGDGTGDIPVFSARLLSLAARALVLLAVIGPILAAIGYVNATEALMVPAALTLAVAATFLALQPVTRDLYALAFRKTREQSAEALLPVLLDFLLVFAALPVVALIWGARPESLGDIYARFWEGISIGGARITPESIVAVALVFALGFLATRLLQGALKSTVLPRTKLDPGARTAVTSGVGYVGIAIAALIAITAGGIDLTALGVVVGALSVGIGFGLQNVVNNFVSGIILLIERPISEGDWIEVGGTMGIVKDISVRSTRIETFDRTDVIVPNADLIAGTVTNWTRGNTIGRAIVTVGVAYGTDTRRVQDILLEIARGHPSVAAYPEPAVDFLGFGADSLDFRVRVILRDINELIAVKTELNHRIAERFVAEGIEIPFAQRDIWLRNPEALTGRAPVPLTELGGTDTTGDAKP